MKIHSGDSNVYVICTETYLKWSAQINNKGPFNSLNVYLMTKDFAETLHTC